MILECIKDRIRSFSGKIGIYYIDLKSGESFSAGNCDVFLASGSVKIITLVEAFKRIEEGNLSKSSSYTLNKSEFINIPYNKNKTFGALEFVHDGIKLTLEDLYRLSTAVSDNIAFNVLLRTFGIDAVNRTLDSFGFYKTRINREIYDEKKIKKGIQNYVSIEEMASLLYRMYKGQLISNVASKEMIGVLKEHQQNSIIPYYFGETLDVAHQTGFDDGLIMDMGIVYSKNPFVLCMAAEDSNTRNAERIMRDITLICYKNSNKSEKTD